MTEEAKKDPEVVIEKTGANEKVWETVIIDNDGKQKTVMLTKDELAEVDAEKVVALNYVGNSPDPWWKLYRGREKSAASVRQLPREIKDKEALVHKLLENTGGE